MGASRWVVGLERAWDAARLRRAGQGPPAHFRIEVYGGHGSAAGVVVRGRVLDNRPPSEAVEGEGLRAALLRTMSVFVTDELPGVPLRVSVGDASVTTTTDEEGYFKVRLRPDPATLVAPWTDGSVELDGTYRGLTEPHTTRVRVRVPAAGAAYAVISDVDDTVLETGVQRAAQMVRRTSPGRRSRARPSAVPPSSTATSPPTTDRSSTSRRARGTCTRSCWPSSTTTASRPGRCCCVTCSVGPVAASRRRCGSRRSSSCTRRCRSC